MTQRLTILREYCEKAGLPYYEIAASGKLGLSEHDYRDGKIYVHRYSRANAFVGMIKNARVFGPGFLFTEDGEYILHGLTSGNYPAVLEAQIRKYLIPPKRDGEMVELKINQDAPFIDEEAILLWGTDNWGHWIFTYLHRLTQLFFLPKLPTRKFLLWDGVPMRFMPWLEKMDITEKDIIRAPDCSAISRLWVPSVVQYRGTLLDEEVYVLPEAVHVFRRQILQYRALGLSSRDKRERIYISRAKARWRRISNEDELVKRLSELGVRTVYIEDLSVDEQIDLVSRAELIVSVVGAASPITMLAPKDAVIIEITLPKFSGIFGSRLWAQILGQEFIRIDGTRDDSGNNARISGVDRDVIVSVDEIASFIPT